MTADISGAKYFGVVADGAKVNVTGSKVHDIGDTDPLLYGMQRGRAIVYINGASGTISGNKVYDFQKSGIEVSGGAVDGGSVRASNTTSASVTNNVVTGWGPTDYIAQNGIVIRTGANATVNKNTVSNFNYTPDGTEATGVLLFEAGRVNVQNNKISANEVNHRRLRPHRRPRQALAPDLTDTDRGLHAEAPVFFASQGDCPALRPADPVRRLAPRRATTPLG